VEQDWLLLFCLADANLWHIRKYSALPSLEVEKKKIVEFCGFGRKALDLALPRFDCTKPAGFVDCSPTAA